MFTAPAGNVLTGLSAVSLFAAKAGDMPILSSVLIQVRDGEVRFIATDRYRIGVWQVGVSGGALPEDTTDGEWLVDVADVKAMVRAAKVASREAQLPIVFTSVATGVEWRLMDGRRGNLRIVAGEFPPNITRLIPEGEPMTGADGQIAVNPNYLADFAKVSRLIKSSDPLVFEWTKQGGPLRVRIGAAFSGVLMPVRLRGV